MKKLLCMALGFCILFVFTSCGAAKTASEGDKVDVEYYAKLGKIPESEYSLGAGIDEMQAKLSAAFESAGEDADVVYEVSEGERTVGINTGATQYYYMKDKKTAGVGFMVNYEKAYGFEPGTVIIEVRDALEKFKADEHEASGNELFFLPVTENNTVLSYTFGKYKLMFVFQDNALCATAIYNPENWTL